MPLSLTRRRRAQKAIDQVAAGLQILSYKLMGPMSVSRLEDARDHFADLQAILEDGQAAIRSAIWTTTTAAPRKHKGV